MALILKIAGVTTPFSPDSVNIALRQRQPASFSVELRQKTNAGGAVPVGVAVEFWDGATQLFGGTVAQNSVASLVDVQDVGLRQQLSCVGWEQRLQTVRCYDPATGTIPTYSRNFPYTVNASTDVITTASAHGRVNGDIVRVKAAANSGVVPGGLSVDTDYYVINATATTLKLAATAGGSAIDITSAGTGAQVLITMRAGEIVADLLTHFAPSQGITVGTIAYGSVVDRISFDAVTVWEAIQALAKLSNYYANVSPTKVLYFQSATVNPAPFGITATSAFKALTVRQTREDKCNNVLVRIPWAQVVPKVDSFTGDGATRAWTLAAPVQAIISIKINGQQQAIGQYLQDSGKAFYWDQGSKTILQDASGTTLTASQQLQVSYYACGQNIVRSYDSADQASTAAIEGGSGDYAVLVDRSGVAGEGLIQAAADGSAMVAAQKAVAVEVSHTIETVKLAAASQQAPGQVQTVNLPYYGINAAYLLDSVAIRDVKGKHLMVTTRALSGAFLGSYLDYYQNLVAGKAASATTGAGVVATAGPTTPADLNVATIYVDSLNLYSNSPSAGRVSWLACTVYYKGAAYHITAGDTDKRFITWTVGGVAFVSGDTYTPTPGLFLIATNTSGTVDEAWNKGGAAAGSLQRSNLSFALLEGFALRPPTGANLSVTNGSSTGSATVLSYTGAGALLTIGLYEASGVPAADPAVGETITYYIDVTIDGQPTYSIPLMKQGHGTAMGQDPDAAAVGFIAGSFPTGSGVISLQLGVSFLASCVVTVRYATSAGTVAVSSPTTIRGVAQWASKI